MVYNIRSCRHLPQITTKLLPLYSTKNWKVRVIITFLTLSKMFEGKLSLCPLLSILQSQFLMLPTYFCYLLKDSTIPTQGYKCCWKKEPWLQVQHACKVGLKKLCQHASCKHMNIMVSVDGNFCSHLGTVFRAVPDCMRQTGWGATRLN